LQCDIEPAPAWLAIISIVTYCVEATCGVGFQEGVALIARLLVRLDASLHLVVNWVLLEALCLANALKKRLEWHAT